MTLKKFIACLAVTLLATQIFVSISTMRTDIRLLESQVGMLTDEVVSLKVEQERINSRLRYTVTVQELEVAMQKIDDLRNDFEEFSLTYKTTDQVFKHLFGEAWGK